MLGVLLSSKIRAISSSSSLGSLVIFLFLIVSLVNETGLDFVKNDLVSFLEGLLETSVKTLLSSGSLGLLGTSSLGALGLEGSDLGGLASDGSLLLGGFESLGGGVEDLHKSLVLKRVLLALGGLLGVDSLDAELGLDLVRVDDSGEVSAGHHGSSERESGLDGGGLSVGTEDGVELVESGVSEDHKSSHVATGAELEKVKSGNIAGVDTGEVSSGLLDAVIRVVDDKGSLTEGETRVSHLTLTGALLLGRADTLEVTVNSEERHGLKELGGLGAAGEGGNKGKLGDRLDSVTTGHDEGSASGGSEGGGDSVSLLVEIDLSVPFSPDLEGSEHASLTAHVTESTLTGSVGTRARDSGNTGDSATGTPRLSGMLVTSPVEDGVTLSSVLGHVGVAELDEIISDGGGEHGGHVQSLSDGSILGGVSGVDRDGGTGNHLLKVLRCQIIIVNTKRAYLYA